jgi:hypothetical protein
VAAGRSASGPTGHRVLTGAEVPRDMTLRESGPRRFSRHPQTSFCGADRAVEPAAPTTHKLGLVACPQTGARTKESRMARGRSDPARRQVEAGTRRRRRRPARQRVRDRSVRAGPEMGRPPPAFRGSPVRHQTAGITRPAAPPVRPIHEGNARGSAATLGGARSLQTPRGRMEELGGLPLARLGEFS